MSTTRGIAVVTLGNLVPPLAALASQPLLAQNLGVVGRGELAAAVAPLQFASLILTFGIPESFTYFVARRVSGRSRSLRLGMLALGLVGLAGSGLVAILAPVLSAGDEALARLISLASLALLPTLLVAGMRGIASGYQSWGRVALQRSLGAIVQLVGVVVLILVSALTVTSATVVLAVATFIGGLVYLFPDRRRLTSGGGDFPATDSPTPRSFAVQAWFGTVAGLALARLDQLLMTPLAGVYELGLYVVAVNVSEVILVFNLAVKDVIASVEAASPDPARVGRAARLSTLVTAVLGVILAAICPWAIPALFGEEFGASVPVAALLIAGIILSNPGSVAGAALSGRGKPGLRSAAAAIASLANLVAFILLVPAFGAMGAAWAAVLGRLVAALVSTWFMGSRSGVPMSDFYGLRIQDLVAMKDLVRTLRG